MTIFYNASLLKKLLLIALAPLVGLILTSTFYLEKAWSERAEAIEAAKSAASIRGLSSFVHELQKERGLSVGYVNSVGGGEDKAPP